ncbi:BURP domain-containing protein, partial [Prunus dulcis]
RLSLISCFISTSYICCQVNFSPNGVSSPTHLCLLSLAAVALANHAAQPAPQLYWNSVLPNTQMPRAISELLHPDSTNEEKSTNIMNAKDMRPGATTNFQFPRNSNTATFLPREMKPTSVEAKTIKQTIEECEAPGVKGEEKYCATSLESMVDFSTSKLRTRNVQAISTEVLEKGATMSMHKYTTMPGLKKLAGDKVVVCHKQNYPYARLCSLPESDDGVTVKAVAICHLDTSEWNPKHLAFQILKVKPGTIPICHFLPTDHIVWAPNHKSA